MVFSLRFISYHIKNDIFRRHNKALYHIKILKEPNLKIINEVLSLNSLVTQGHFDLCTTLVDQNITLDFPKPHTDKVIPFSKVAGIENLENLRKTGKFIPGCYRI